MLKDKKVAIIGVGRMGGILLNSFMQSGLVMKENLVGSNSRKERADYIGKKYGIKTYTNNKELVIGKDIIIIAVEPILVRDVLYEIKEIVHKKQLIISIAAGVKTSSIEGILDKNIPVIRALPTSLAQINESITVIFAGKYVGKYNLKIATNIFKTIGLVEIIKREELMNPITALSCIPAYVYTIVDSLIEGVTREGLSKELAKKIVNQNIYGATKMVLKTGHDLALLIEPMVTPGGVTEEGLKKLKEGNMRKTFIEVISSTTKKCKELS